MLLAKAPLRAQFNLDTQNAGPDLIIPIARPIVFQDISPSGSDASLVIRWPLMISAAWFDAIAPYHPTAVGIYTRLGRRPASEATQRNINIAMIYSAYRALNSLAPQRNADWRRIMAIAGLNPDDTSEDITTPVGLGNRAGRIVSAIRERDGMNQLGDEGGRLYNRMPYADYTGYEPVNTAYELRDPSRWQPGIVTSGNGLFRVQQFVTPQWADTLPFSYKNPASFHLPRPSNSDPRGNRRGYQEQVDEVLRASANLTDYQKMSAELFNNKFASLGFSAGVTGRVRGLTLMQSAHLDFLVNMAAFDAGIAAWYQKRKWDAVRPFSAVAYLYGKRPITAWGGPGRGTVMNLPADQWRGYLGVSDHPEYPSGSATFCAAHAQAARRFFGTDALNLTIPVAKGSSRVEPGITPANDLVLGPYATWTDFEVECAQSRIWGGVHFRAAIDEGRKLGTPIGELAWQFFKAHLDGTAPPPPQR